jgi:hypothetical protein
VDSVRDLAGAQVWRESLERSRSRRGLPPRPARSADTGRSAEGAPSLASLLWAFAGPRLRAALARRPLRFVAALSVIVVLALLAGLSRGASDGRGDSVPAKRMQARKSARKAVSAPLVVPGPSTAATARTAATAGADVGAASCQPVGNSSGYVNPLASATVKPKRIDQGVDYTGSGALKAIGAGTVTEVALTDTGWPGAFIEYRLTAGPDAGCFVFYAEGVTPVPGLTVGQVVRAGRPIATLIAGYAAGIEVGWGAGVGTATLAAQRGEWSSTNDTDSIPTGTGRSFSALIAALGGPPGKVGG